MRTRSTITTLLLAVLLAYAPGALAQTRPFSPTVAIQGQIATQRTYTLADLQALPAETTDQTAMESGQVRTRTYRGVKLYDLLQAAGPQLDTSRHNDHLRWYALVTGTDGYHVVIAWGEMDPGFEGKAVLLACERDGQLLDPANGMAQLVVPGDQRAGRHVSNIRMITVLSAPDA
jgi:DMSO/TMAO reductase YedYZ molybdopterin-dependent catalytic subunit